MLYHVWHWILILVPTPLTLWLIKHSPSWLVCEMSKRFPPKEREDIVKVDGEVLWIRGFMHIWSECECSVCKYHRQNREIKTMAETQRYEWKWNGVVAGHITIDTDRDGLPTLVIEPEDDHYSGVMDHPVLFRLITELAERSLKKAKG